MGIFIIQTIFIIILVIFIFYLVFYTSKTKLVNRISKYCIKFVKEDELSYFEEIKLYFNKVVKKISSIIIYFPFIKKYSLKYNKYISYDNYNEKKSIDYVSYKIIVALLFMLLSIFSNIIVPMFSTSQILFIGLFGFFTIDIYFIFYNKIKRKKVEEDLLNAIIIMNNAFRSGRSVIQAIEIVSKELKGPISQEFKKMHLEINYGLSLDVVFDRFAKRVDSKEVNYITSSLSILNKTGGNIINVFSSIEKIMFDKRKLKTEMQSLTSSSKLVSLILIIMPIMIALFITILSPTYFMPLITTNFGKLILFIIILMYLTYIYLITKIMKVRYGY